MLQRVLNRPEWVLFSRTCNGTREAPRSSIFYTVGSRFSYGQPIFYKSLRFNGSTRQRVQTVMPVRSCHSRAEW